MQSQSHLATCLDHPRGPLTEKGSADSHLIPGRKITLVVFDRIQTPVISATDEVTGKRSPSATEAPFDVGKAFG
jgi:hypothetical protein